MLVEMLVDLSAVPMVETTDFDSVVVWEMMKASRMAEMTEVKQVGSMAPKMDTLTELLMEMKKGIWKAYLKAAMMVEKSVDLSAAQMEM